MYRATSSGGTYTKVNASPLPCSWKPVSPTGGAERVAAESVRAMVSYVVTVEEQRRASDAFYAVDRGSHVFTGPPRLLRLGLEATF